MYSSTASAIGFSTSDSSSRPLAVSNPWFNGPTIRSTKESSSRATRDKVPTDSMPLAAK